MPVKVKLEEDGEEVEVFTAEEVAQREEDAGLRQADYTKKTMATSRKETELKQKETELAGREAALETPERTTTEESMGEEYGDDPLAGKVDSLADSVGKIAMSLEEDRKAREDQATANRQAELTRLGDVRLDQVERLITDEFPLADIVSVGARIQNHYLTKGEIPSEVEVRAMTQSMHKTLADRGVTVVKKDEPPVKKEESTAGNPGQGGAPDRDKPKPNLADNDEVERNLTAFIASKVAEET